MIDFFSGGGVGGGGTLKNVWTPIEATSKP